MTTLYLIRHAQSEGNSEGRLQGATNRPLSPLGQAQLEPLAQRCRDIPAVHIYSSPLLRAMETAKAANRFLNLPITQREDIREIDVGLWENKTQDEIEERWPEQRRIWREEHYRFEAPGGETMAQVYARVSAAIKDIAASHPGQTVIVVSHGCAIRNMCAWAMGGPENATSQVWVGNTSVSRIDIDEAGVPSLAFRGDVSHIPEDVKSPGDKV